LTKNDSGNLPITVEPLFYLHPTSLMEGRAILFDCFKPLDNTTLHILILLPVHITLPTLITNKTVDRLDFIFFASPPSVTWGTQESSPTTPSADHPRRQREYLVGLLRRQVCLSRRSSCFLFPFCGPSNPDGGSKNRSCL
jgi:hypothetical protein